MPFSATRSHPEDYWTRHFEEFLRPSIEETGRVKAKRSTPLRGDIVKQIVSDLVTSPVAVADLTDHNPNVFWELGVRQSFRSGTITIASKGTPLPFDVAAKGTLFYDTENHIHSERFGRNLRAAVIDCLDNPNHVDSPIVEAIVGRGSLYQMVWAEENRRRFRAVAEEFVFNHALLQETFKTASSNRAWFKRRNVLTFRFRGDAVASLVINRYLDEQPEFYHEMQNYQVVLGALNSELDRWGQSGTMTEKWLRKNQILFLDLFKKVENRFERLAKILLFHQGGLPKPEKPSGATFTAAP
jgi:hypothetical protein